MAPARGISQSLADRLLVGTRGLDFRSTVSKAAAILKSVSTLADLLERFAKTIGEAVGTDRVLMLLASTAFLCTGLSGACDRGQSSPCPKNNVIVRYLQAHSEPLVLDELHRIRATPELDALMSEMHRLNCAVAMPIFAREHLEGIMLFGPRHSGRIYGSVEQSALQVLCGQLGVAIENAELFTEVQNAKLYNETLLEHLTSGVIAVSADERVTVFNNEAGQITDLSPRDIIDRPVEHLPEPLRNVLRDTLALGRAGRESRDRPSIWRAQCGGASEQLDLPWAGRRDAGRADGVDRYHGFETPRATDSPERSPGQSRDALGGHGARDQKSARLDQDFHAIAPGAISRLGLP